MLKYPIQFRFAMFTIANDFSAVDAEGNTLGYVKKKHFKIKEQVDVFTDSSRKQLLYKVRTNQWLDFTASYQFTNSQDIRVGRIARQGLRSLWKAHYEIFDDKDQLDFIVKEESAWIKVFDSIFSEIPIIGLFSGYFLNPAYIILNSQHQIVARLKKKPSFWSRKFSLEKLTDYSDQSEERLLLGSMMLLFLERDRG